MIKLYLVINNFTSWITKLSEVFFLYFDLFNTQKEVHIQFTQSARSKCAAADNLATNNEISATNFTLVRLLLRTRFGLCCLLLSPACIPLKNILTGLIHVHTYINVGLGYMCGPALLKEINEL